MKIFLCLLLLKNVVAFIFLEKLSYIKLPSVLPPRESYKMFGGTAEEAAYDPTNQVLYVVGETSRLLHLIDISNPGNPVRFHSHQFQSNDGTPRDVAVCGTEVAVVLSSPIKDVYEGHVMFFKTAKINDTTLVNDGKLPVGMFPDMVTFKPDCSKVLIANEARAGRDVNNKFTDPPGSISIIDRGGSGNSERFAYFNGYENRIDIRFPSRSAQSKWPLPEHPLFSNDVEPEYIAISPDGRDAYVTLQRNDAVAVLSLSTYAVTSVNPLPHKDWTDITVDVSDLDGGIHMRQYPLKSLRQPDNAKVLTIGRKKFLITADEGKTTSYTNSLHGFSWNDYTTCAGIVNSVDTQTIKNDTFIADLRVNSKIGHLICSAIDGKNLFTQKLDEVDHFGGRGFSIWDTSDFSLVYDSKDEIEKEMQTGMPNVFNTDCVSSTITSKSPDNLKDTQSDNYGPKIGTLDLITDNGNTYIVIGSETVGAIFLYSVDTSSGVPVPKFETAYRNGESDYVWQELYNMDIAGDAGISAIGFIPAAQNSKNQTLIYVVGGISGSVALYQINTL